MEKRASGDRGDSRDRFQSRLGSQWTGCALGAPRVRCSVTRSSALSPRAEQTKPECRVGRRARADKRHAQICHRKDRRTNRVRAQRPVVELSSLEQEVRKPSSSPQDSELAPEAACNEIEVQAADRFALDQRTPPDAVISDAKRLHREVEPELNEQRGHSAVLFACVGHDSHPGCRVARHRPTTCKETADLRPLLALSRCESA